MTEAPTFTDVLLARRRIRPHLRPTACHAYPGLAALTGAAEVVVKHENHQPVGAFKVRGGVNLVSRMPEEERRRGVVAASTGNHGQSLAYAGRLFGVRTIVCVPENANPVKTRAMADLGAEVVAHGRDFDDAREHCERLAAEHGYRYVHSGDEPDLIAGVGTCALEILESEPRVEVLIVPVGGGSGAAAACLVAKTVSPATQVVGVQSAQAPAAWRSWKEHALVEDRMETFAEGLATRTAFALPQAIMREHLDDFVLVDDADIRQAMLAMLDVTHNLVEAAGAAPLAAAMRLRDRLRGRRVALVASGGNVSRSQLAELLSVPQPAAQMVSGTMSMAPHGHSSAQSPQPLQ